MHYLRLFYNLCDLTLIIAGTVSCSEIPFSENSEYIKTSQLISNVNQQSGFYMIELLLKAIRKLFLFLNRFYLFGTSFILGHWRYLKLSSNIKKAKSPGMRLEIVFQKILKRL